MDDRMQSPAYSVLRDSSLRVLRLIEREVKRQGGDGAVIYTDMLERVGSRRIWMPRLSELHALGLIEVVRHPKRFDCRLSSRWRDVASMQDALIISARARVQRMPPQPTPQPACLLDLMLSAPAISDGTCDVRVWPAHQSFHCCCDRGFEPAGRALLRREHSIYKL